MWLVKEVDSSDIVVLLGELSRVCQIVQPILNLVAAIAATNSGIMAVIAKNNPKPCTRCDIDGLGQHFQASRAISSFLDPIGYLLAVI